MNVNLQIWVSLISHGAVVLMVDGPDQSHAPSVQCVVPPSDGVMVILITNITNPRSGWYLALIAH